MKRKVIAMLITAMMATSVLAGCGGSDTAENSGTGTDTAEADAGEEASGDEADVNEDGTVNNPEAVKVDGNKLVFWSLFSGGDGEFMDQIISDYNTSGPSQEVQSIMLVWDDYYTKLQTAALISTVKKNSLQFWTNVKQ